MFDHLTNCATLKNLQLVTSIAPQVLEIKLKTRSDLRNLLHKTQ